MKNNLILKLASKIKLNIKGKNIQRFIKRLKTNNIEIIKIDNLKYNSANIIIYKKDYDKLIELKSIYDVDLINNYGIIKLREVVSIYKYILVSILICLGFIIFLSNIIFDVKVIHNDSEVRNFMLKQLEEYGIKKYNFKKNYDDLNKIKQDILTKYKDTIEWLEIENIGTSYIIRLENRIIKDNNSDNSKNDIVSSKSAIIRKIIAEKGNVVKELNTYVNKDEVIISGSIYLNDELKEITGAKGTVYGEVWYNVIVEYPYIYSEIKQTGNTKNAIVLKFLNKDIEVSLNKFMEKTFEEEIIFKNDLIPISIVKQKQKELNTESFVLTQEEAISRAKDSAINKMNDKLKDDEYIIDNKILKTNIKEDKVILEVFFAVYENITSYIKIEGE